MDLINFNYVKISKATATLIFTILGGFFFIYEKTYAITVENFDSYTASTTICNQGNWKCASDNHLATTTNIRYASSSPNSLLIDTGVSGNNQFTNLFFATSSEIYISFKLYAHNRSSGSNFSHFLFNLGDQTSGLSEGNILRGWSMYNYGISGGYKFTTNGGSLYSSNVNFDSWVSVVIKYHNGTSSLSVDGGNTYTTETFGSNSPISRLSISNQSDSQGYIYIDDILITTENPNNLNSEIYTYTYSTSTRTVNITGYWNINTTSSSTYQYLKLWEQSDKLGIQNLRYYVATTTGIFNINWEFNGLAPSTTLFGTTTTPQNYDFTIYAELKEGQGSYFEQIIGTENRITFNPWNSSIQTILDATSTYFSPAMNNNLGFSTSTDWLNNPDEIPEYECSITSLVGCIKNAGVWLFKPDKDVIENFKSLNEVLPTKLPFSYAYDINEMRKELFESNATGTTSISLTFKIIPGQGTSTLELISKSKLEAVPFANTVKTILGFILWFLAIEYIYYRVLKSHDANSI